MWGTVAVIVILLIAVLVLMGMVLLAKSSSTGALMTSSGRTKYPDPAPVRTVLEINFMTPSLIECVQGAKMPVETLTVSKHVQTTLTGTEAMVWTLDPRVNTSSEIAVSASMSPTIICVENAIKKFKNENAPSMPDQTMNQKLAAQSKNITQLVTSIVDRNNEFGVFLKKFLNTFLTQTTLDHPTYSKFVLRVRDGSFVAFPIDSSPFS